MAEYRVRVISAHPDKIADEEAKVDAQARFHTLQNAKEILCDPSKRKHYDTYLAMGSHIPLKDWMDNQDKLQQVRSKVFFASSRNHFVTNALFWFRVFSGQLIYRPKRVENLTLLFKN